MVLNKNKSKKVIEESSTESESEQDSCQDYSEEEDDQYSESGEECSSSEQEESSSESEEESEDEKPKKKTTKKVIKKVTKKKYESDSEEESEDEPEIIKAIVEKTKKSKEEEISKSIMEEVLFMISFKLFNENVIENTIDMILLGALDDELFNYFEFYKMKKTKIMNIIQEARQSINKFKMAEFMTMAKNSLIRILDLSDLDINYKNSDNDNDNKYFKYFSSLSLCFGKSNDQILAQLVHLKIKDRIFCESDGKKGNNIYYCSENTNYWILDSDGSNLRNKINEIISKTCECVGKSYRRTIKNNKIIAAVNKNIESNIELKNSSRWSREIAKKIIDVSNKYGECMSLKYGNTNIGLDEEKNRDSDDLLESFKIKSIYQFYPNISEHFNNINPNITAFQNMLYDFKLDVARKAEPTELISMFIDYNYEEMSESMQTRMNYIRQNLLLTILNIDEEVEYVLSLFSRFLIDDCPKSQNFYIFKGTGGNGKGLLLRLLTGTLSVYSGSIKPEYFDSKKSGITGTGADPTLAKMVGKRIGLVGDIDDEKNFKVSLSTIKGITGRDPMDYRDLFGKSKEKVFIFTPIFLTNVLIDFSDAKDGQGVTNNAIPRRLRTTSFFNTFDDEVDKNNKYAKLKSCSLKNVILNPQYKIAFFHILREAFYKLRDNKFIVKETTISTITKKHFLCNFDDNFDEFINNITIKDETVSKTGSYNKIKVSDLYDKYKLYCYYNEKILDPKIFKTKMTDLLRYEIVKISTHYYKNIKYVADYDNIIKKRIEKLKEEQDKDKSLEKEIKKIVENNNSSSITTSKTPKTNDRTNVEFSEPECDAEGNFEPDTKSKKKTKNSVKAN